MMFCYFLLFHADKVIANQDALKSTLISIPLGIVIDVTSFIWLAVHSRSIYLLYIVIYHWSQVFEPSPHGVLRQQIRRCLFGTRTGPVILTCCALALATSWLVTCCMGGSRLPEKVIRVRLTSWSSRPYFFSLSAIFINNISIIKKNNIFTTIKRIKRTAFPLIWKYYNEREK